jgi:hypothetical protein
MFVLKKVLFSVAICMGLYCCVKSTTMAPKKANPILTELNFLFAYDDEIVPKFLALEAFKKPLSKGDCEAIYAKGLLSIVSRLRQRLLSAEDEKIVSTTLQACLPVVAYHITEHIFAEHRNLIGTALGNALELLHYTVLFYWAPKEAKKQSALDDAFSLFCKPDGSRKTPQAFEADSRRLMGREYLRHWLHVSKALRLWALEGVVRAQQPGDTAKQSSSRRCC